MQTFPSSVHAVPLACFASAGHAAFVPVQLSAASHSPAVARQTVVVGRKPSAGQLALVPVHVSATSHTPAAARHTVVVGSSASAGHVLLVPVHVSSTSHTPADARHVTPALPATCWQVSWLPSHRSVVQTFPSSVHPVPLACFASAGQPTLVPVQVSATSHSPAAARHTVVVGSRLSAGHALLVPVQVSTGSQMPAEARHVVPPLPAGCWQVSWLPSH